ncbi:MAG TPA: nuclear transport factor 2 family protein [Vicinamibacteria bacterium]|nr:nuclear transport factor 2 family protein [Vicinamibacteria bacterium]
MAHLEPTERDLVRRVNDRFYHALESLDLEAMESVWLHEPAIACVHPGWDVLVGWEAVRRSFEQIFASTTWLRVTTTASRVEIIGEVALVSCAENITGQSGDDVNLAVAQATNIYRRTPAGWRMIHHHSSPVPVEVTHPFSGIVQ